MVVILGRWLNKGQQVAAAHIGGRRERDMYGGVAVCCNGYIHHYPFERAGDGKAACRKGSAVKRRVVFFGGIQSLQTRKHNGSVHGNILEIPVVKTPRNPACVSEPVFDSHIVKVDAIFCEDYRTIQGITYVSEIDQE
ncbi:hypothetical protein SDC9_83086 [bioreactor metagenome]|uniref:Uncharacterized protein n=1 Tax=bioreactor metagenome TaxID=1076179 RepID=A0A644Z878_9ZZZZ